MVRFGLSWVERTRLPRRATSILATSVVTAGVLVGLTPGAGADTAAPAPAPASDPAALDTGSVAAVTEVESPSSEIQRAGEVDPEDLQRAMLPEPSGDPFFDDIPEGMEQADPGDVLVTRDISGMAASRTPVPLARADQYVVRSTEPDGTPTRATATLLTPAEPWHGDGSRPVMVHAEAIDALGTECTPGYTWANGDGAHSSPVNIGPPVTDGALAAGYAVLLPDHEGPEMAYADPYVAGYSILDTIRGVGDVAPELADSPVAMLGYSGGAIALNGAVKLLDDYAPELSDRVTGAALGGTPADFELLMDSMSGNLAIGLLSAAVMGLLRHNTEIIPLVNDTGVRLATSPIKDQCIAPLAAAGIVQAPIDAFIADGGRDSPVLRDFVEYTRMRDMKSAVPLYIYHGEQEFWVPAEGARTLAEEQSAMGVPVEYVEVMGEHFVASYTGYDGATAWLDDRLRGEEAGSNCS